MKCIDCGKTMEHFTVEKAQFGLSTYVDVCRGCLNKYPINERGVRQLNAE